MIYNLGYRALNRDEILIVARIGINATTRKLYLTAAAISRFNNEWIARCIPHPAHGSPVNVKNGHLGNNILELGLI